MIQVFNLVRANALVFALTLCVPNNPKTLDKPSIILQQNSLSHLKQLRGKYPKKAKLVHDAYLKKHLKKLQGDRINWFEKNWAVETPIEIKNNMFSAWGCQQHNCSNTNFIIVVDFKKNVVYVGIREEENVKVYSEDGSSNILVSNWANRIN